MMRISIIILSLFFSYSAYAFPLPVGAEFLRKTAQLPKHVAEKFTADHDFEGIVELSNCSGSLIQFEQESDQDNAKILTNGHCLEQGFMKPGDFLFNQAIPEREFNLLDSQGKDVATVTSSLVVYATMTKTDITIYKLDQTYAQIKAQSGIRPWILASQKPVDKTPVEVISGYWHRGYSCQIEQTVFELHEGDWTFTESMRYSRPGCETIHGTSGSPLIAQGTRNVIGINNTGNDDGQKCTENNPCEVDTNGNIVYVKGYSYAQQTYFIYSCLNTKSEIDVNNGKCLLPH